MTGTERNQFRVPAMSIPEMMQEIMALVDLLYVSSMFDSFQPCPESALKTACLARS